MLSVFLWHIKIFPRFCQVLSQYRVASWGFSSSVCDLPFPWDGNSWGNSLLTHVLNVNPLTVLQVSLELPYPLNCTGFAPKRRCWVLSWTSKSSPPSYSVTFSSKPGLFSPYVFSSYCHLQTLVSCFSYNEEITPDTKVWTLYSKSFLWLIFLFSTSGRKNPPNMTITRFASILVTISEHQLAGLEDIFF